MNFYFDEPTRRSELLTAARQLEGTPFADHQGVPNVGVDCIHLAALLYRAAGLLDAVPTFPAYTMDGGQHDGPDLLVEWLLGSDRFALVWSGARPFKTPALGDLLCLTLGRQPWHCAVMLDAGEIIEVHHGSKVARRPLADPTWSRRVTSIWRPIAP